MQIIELNSNQDFTTYQVLQYGHLDKSKNQYTEELSPSVQVGE
jgi:hypothetical protein